MVWSGSWQHVLSLMPSTKCSRASSCLPAVTWTEYCRYDVKPKTINQSINQSIALPSMNLINGDTVILSFVEGRHVLVCTYFSHVTRFIQSHCVCKLELRILTFLSPKCIRSFKISRSINKILFGTITRWFDHTQLTSNITTGLYVLLLIFQSVI